MNAIHQINSNCSNIILLSLSEIAAWQIDSASISAHPFCTAELPALQRGAVWKVGQIEALWDSIFQGFPLGAFLLSPYDSALGQQAFKLQQGSATRPQATHMLLDGQQRATGIALGFLNPWNGSYPGNDVKSVLWIDLAPPTKGRDVTYVFRSITRAHPWGYSSIDPESRITQRQVRQSLSAFRIANAPLYDQAKPHKIPLGAVWPWDAKAPIPLAMMVDALRDTNGHVESAKAVIWKAVKTLPFMRQLENDEDGNSIDYLKHWMAQQSEVRNAFENENPRLDEILKTLWLRLSEYVIPANVVPDYAINRLASSTAANGGQSPIETLFIRVNSAGTPLGGEELMYSLIKSSWPQAPEAISLLMHKLATPARTALLASRLVLARHQRKPAATELAENSGGRLRLTSTPNVSDFRHLMSGQNKEHPNFARDLRTFIEGNGIQVFEKAYTLLTNGAYSLPPVLASELAQKSPDIFFLFLCWLDRLMFDPTDGVANVSSEISQADMRRTLGFLTALAWFSKGDSKLRAAGAIWHDLQTLNPSRLSGFFNRQHYLKTIAVDEQGKLNAVPVLAPDVLELALQKSILGYQGCSDTISKPESNIWKDWVWWDWLIDKRRPKDIDTALRPIFHDANLEDGETVSDRVRDTWYQFLECLWGNKSMLLYVQRAWLNQWFDDFDPSLAEHLEDKNRPWDYDHIYPQSFLQGRNGGTLQGLPQLIKNWNNSIGNLRAWPLEANRADGDEAPPEKLKSVSPEEIKYGISIKNKCAASFISEENFNDFWSKCDPTLHGKLNDPNSFPQRQALINAIVWRILSIYRRWYEDLKLANLN